MARPLTYYIFSYCIYLCQARYFYALTSWSVNQHGDGEALYEHAVVHCVEVLAAVRLKLPRQTKHFTRILLFPNFK